MATPRVTKGRITSLRDVSISRTFLFNPNEVSDTKSVNYGSIDIPGSSNPVIQYGSNGERVVSFELYLDGDRGRSNERPKGEATRFAGSGVSIDISNEIRFYRSLLYPSKQSDNKGFVGLFPDILSLSLGEYLTGFTCIVRSAPININYWTPTMAPVRATIPIVLWEVRTENQTAADVFNNEGG